MSGDGNDSKVARYSTNPDWAKARKVTAKEFETFIDAFPSPLVSFLHTICDPAQAHYCIDTPGARDVRDYPVVGRVVWPYHPNDPFEYFILEGRER